MTSRGLLRATALLASLAGLPARAADVQIVNADTGTIGLNDPTPAAPVGGNMATTVGAQRLAVFQEAARIWGALLPSDVPIRVSASFSPLTCSATSAVLGSAFAATVHANFTNAPLPNTWYMKAEADKLAGSHLGTGTKEIVANFNSELGKPGCLSGTFFYLGLDNNNGSDIDFLTVALHEIGHGLGFASPTDETDGTYAGSSTTKYPGIFDRFIFDLTAGKSWDQMTDTERVASAINTRKVVWTGANATTYARATMDTKATLTVTAPAGSAGTYDVGLADFGTSPATVTVSGPVVVATDAADPSGPLTTDACSAINNASAVAGKIALVDRGTCNFVIKAKNVQNAGAIGMIVADWDPNAGLTGMSGTDPTVTIPSVRVTYADGNVLKAAIPTAAVIGPDPTALAGTDASTRLYLYTPNPVEPGSTISHWDTTAHPNLLMEPNISSDLGLGTDATIFALRDMGWFLGSTSLPTSWVLPSSAHASGANGAFYTTGLTIRNTGTSDATATLRFLGHDQDGTGGASVVRAVPAGQTLTIPDVLGSLFSVTAGYGAIQISADSSALKIVSQTSTPPPSGGGTFGQAVPAMKDTDLVTAAAPKALLSLRQDSAFRTNAVIANTTASAVHVVLQLLSANGVLYGTASYDLAPLEMRQIGSVVTALGGPNGTKDAVLLVSTTTGGGRVATYAAVIDQSTNDPRTILPATTGPLGANATWLLPSSAHASGANGAFYTTDLTVANFGSSSASVTLKFLGHDQDGRSGPEVVRTVLPDSATTFADVLGSLFGVASGYGAILVTSNTTDVRVTSQTSTPPPSGVGTFGQSVPAFGPSDAATVAAPKTLVGLRQDGAFRTNAVIANMTAKPAHVDLTLVSETGATLGTGAYDLNPYEMRQIGSVVTALGGPNGTQNAALVVSTPTNQAKIATYAAVIDQTTNDPRTVLP